MVHNSCPVSVSKFTQQFRKCAIFIRAYSDDADHRFRFDGDHDSELMPITVGAKRRWAVLIMLE
jgi:hypothetical protein